MIEIEFLIPLIILVALNLIQLKLYNPGSDHFIHIAYILSIKKNKNKFITNVNQFIKSDEFPDPQLFHWLLSFIPIKQLKKHYYVIPIFLNVLLYLLFNIFINSKYFIDLDISKNNTLYYNLIFVLTPFSYYSWNAKNLGLSARGLGLFLGQLFIYLIVTFHLMNNYIIILLLLTIVSVLIILSSQFTLQFIVFFSLFFAFFQLTPIVSIIIAFLIFLLLFPVTSRTFIKRQWLYKKHYFKFLSDRFLLSYRYSIWRDLFWDFWKKLIFRENYLKTIEYIYRNPVISVLIGFPGLLLILTKYENIVYSQQSILIKILIIGVMIFIITSFRKSRFLGEPERYLEFFSPLIAILVVKYYPSEVIYIIYFSSIVIVFELFTKHKLMKILNYQSFYAKTIILINTLKEKSYLSNSARILSNNFELLKYLADSEGKIFYPSLQSEYTGSIHFNELFPERYGQFSKLALVRIIQEFQINVFILDLKYNSASEIQKIFIVFKYEIIFSNDNFIVYKIE